MFIPKPLRLLFSTIVKDLIGLTCWQCASTCYFWICLQVLGETEHELANQNEYNFDHPDAFDFNLLVNTLRRLKHGKKVEVPVYNFITHSRESKSVSNYEKK